VELSGAAARPAAARGAEPAGTVVLLLALLGGLAQHYVLGGAVLEDAQLLRERRVAQPVCSRVLGPRLPRIQRDGRRWGRRRARARVGALAVGEEVPGGLGRGEALQLGPCCQHGWV
jgi:hypothetical protein